MFFSDDITWCKYDHPVYDICPSVQLYVVATQTVKLEVIIITRN